VKPVLSLALLVALTVPTTAGARTLVSYSESGGIANRRVALTVTTAGVANVTANRRPRTFHLHASTLKRLRHLLAAARFDRVHPPATSCADCVIYSVHYRGHRVRYDDSQARHVPRSVRRVVAELQRIARGGR
jgi:hypothetical protein